jgi:hypothetical protein
MDYVLRAYKQTMYFAKCARRPANDVSANEPPPIMCVELRPARIYCKYNTLLYLLGALCVPVGVISIKHQLPINVHQARRVPVLVLRV